MGFHYQNTFAPGEELFQQAIFQSGGPTGRSFPSASDPLTVRQFEQYVSGVGCQSNETAENLLSCLRAVDVEVLEETATALLAAYRYNGTHPFQPVSGEYSSFFSRTPPCRAG